MQWRTNVEMGSDLQNSEEIQDSKSACVRNRNEKPNIRDFTLKFYLLNSVMLLLTFLSFYIGQFFIFPKLNRQVKKSEGIFSMTLTK